MNNGGILKLRFENEFEIGDGGRGFFALLRMTGGKLCSAGNLPPFSARQRYRLDFKHVFHYMLLRLFARRCEWPSLKMN